MSCRPCQTTVCDVERDDRTYSIQGLPPLPSVQSVPIVPLPFGNDVVYYDGDCAEGQPLVYNGTLPGWITIDTNNNRLVGAAGSFRANSKSTANSDAQARLDSFAEIAINSGALSCQQPS